MNDLALSIEERALNAWPGLHQQQVNGWTALLTDGFTRRGNSVHALGPLHSSDLHPTVEALRVVYGRSELPVRFKISPAAEAHYPDLDDELAGYGLEVITPVTHVMTADAQAFQTDSAIVTTVHPNYEWLTAYCHIEGINTRLLPVLETVLRRIQPEVRYASIVESGIVVAVAMAVVERGYVGLYRVAVREDYRRRGYARRLCAHLLGWGASEGAHTGYLQVHTTNEAALSLYAGMGFDNVYDYWYRVE